MIWENEDGMIRVSKDRKHMKKYVFTIKKPERKRNYEFKEQF